MLQICSNFKQVYRPKMLTSKTWRYLSVSIQQAMKAKTIVLNKQFDGFPEAANFKIIEEDLAALKDGEFLAVAEYFSVDPYQRIYTTKIGKPVLGEQVAKIIDSKNPKFQVGQYIIGEFGWRSHTISDGSPGVFLKNSPKILEDFGGLPKSLALGVLGLTGNTARFGLFEICKPKPENTVVVSAAGGAVGNVVGQLAKIRGCTVVGITGSDAKGTRLIKELGFDAYVNYKNQDFEQKLVESTPNGADCYFDNVGGEISTSVLNRMNKFGNVAISGAVSTYNETKPRAREVQTPVKVQHLIMEGFSVTRWRDQWESGIKQNLKLIQEGKLKYIETVTDGFENLPKAFISMLRGENFGKTIVKV